MWLVWLPPLSALLAFPLYQLAIFSPSAFNAMAFVMAVNITGGFTFGPLLAATQSVVPPQMRASASAFVGFAASIVGVGGGPFLVGVLSERFQESMTEAQALQSALAITICATLVVLIHFVMLVKHFPEDRVS